MSILKLMATQEAAFDTLADVLTAPDAYSVELQNLRANLALAVVNLMPAGAFDANAFNYEQAADNLVEVLTPNFGDVSDPDEQSEIETDEQAALAQVTTLPRSEPINPHGAPPLGGAG